MGSSSSLSSIGWHLDQKTEKTKFLLRTQSAWNMARCYTKCTAGRKQPQPSSMARIHTSTKGLLLFCLVGDEHKLSYHCISISQCWIFSLCKIDCLGLEPNNYVVVWISHYKKITKCTNISVQRCCRIRIILTLGFVDFWTKIPIKPKEKLSFLCFLIKILTKLEKTKKTKKTKKNNISKVLEPGPGRDFCPRLLKYLFFWFFWFFWFFRVSLRFWSKNKEK